MIQFLSLLVIMLVIHFTLKATDYFTDLLLSSKFPSATERMQRKQETRAKKVGKSEAKQRNRIQLNEEEYRLEIENSMEQTTPITALVDDSHRVCARFMLAHQRHNIPKLRIPAELYEIIHQYFDYNDIRTLFQIRTSPQDRQTVFGFTSYVKMHRYLPSRAAKVTHLKDLKGDWVIGWNLDSDAESDTDGETDPANGVKFDDQDVFIRKLWFWNRGPNSVLNWEVIAKLTHLKELRIGYLDMSISMEDIRKLPQSLKVLDIRGNIWTTAAGDVDLSLLPRGLEKFVADNCQGMHGILEFDAPESNLTELSLRECNLQPRLRSETNIPPSLKRFQAPPGFKGYVILRVMEERDIEIIL